MNMYTISCERKKGVSGEELAERDGQQEACLEAGAVAIGIHLLIQRVRIFKRTIPYIIQ